MRRSGCWGLLLTSVLAAPLLAYKEVPPPEKVVLPKPRSAAESLASIAVPAGLEAELVAAEPMVKDPIDLAWDARGRMWVVEMADYPNGVDGAGKPGGRIRVLESTRGDGRFDQATLFAEELNFPTSVLPWRNGVLVTAVPHVLFLEDTDGDGRADKRTPLFSGLAEGNPQHLTNGLQWGLDGWLHLANGNSGGKIVSPQFPRALEIGQRDFRIQPDTGAFEVLAGQSQAGRSRDDWGNWFGCNNSNPIWHYALEERYLRRNPNLVSPHVAVTVAAVPGASRVYPRSETLARFNDPHGFNHFTSACGVMIYRDDWLGPDYAGNVFVCEPVHNLVHREIVRPAGPSFRSERALAEQASEFLASTDLWSRFTAVRAGPDGALYVADMYRLVIEHPKWIPDAWQKELGNLRAGENEGRIYRIKPRGKPLRTVARLDTASGAGLVAGLESPSGLVRDLAQQQLTWRKETGVRPAIEQLVRRSERPETRAQALWTLHTMDALEPGVVEHALRDPHAGVRRQAVRLSETFTASQPALLRQLVTLVDDPDFAVRMQLACTLGEWKEREAGVALAQLLRGVEDRYLKASAMSSALPHAATMLGEFSSGGRADEALMMEVATVTENAWALGALLKRIAASGTAGNESEAFVALGQLLDWLQRNGKTFTQLPSLGGEALAEPLAAVDRVFAAARKTAVDAGAAIEVRMLAAQLLGRGRSRQTEDVDVLARLLTPMMPVELQMTAAGALGRINRPQVAEQLLAGWGGYSGKVRMVVLDALLSRPAWAQTLLDRLEKEPEMAAQIDAGRRAVLLQHGNARVAERAAVILNSGAAGDRQKTVDRYLAAMKPLEGKAQRGADVFAAVCSACHVFGQVPGRRVGPDLAAVKDRSAPYLLTHILDPNRAVEDRYVFYTATLHDGRSVAGMIVGEAGNSLTMVGLDGVEQTILRSEVRSLVSGGRSLMPEGLEGAINEQAMADLLAFLAGGTK